MTAYSLGVEVACDGPADHQDCPRSAAVARAYTSVTAPQVRADGRAVGWATGRRGGRTVDVCPDCRMEAAR